MIDLDQLDAHLDLALTDDLRVQPPVVGPRGLPPAPDPVPAPVAPPCRRPARRNASSRPSPSPPVPSPPVPSPLAPPELVWDELDLEQHGRAVVELISQAKLAEADLHLAAHADLAGDSRRHRGDAVGWLVMRALLDGRERAARTGIDELLTLDRDGRNPESHDRYWVQRLALALTWGDDDERYDVLDHCRERAYCHGELAWQGRLTLLLARMGRTSEAVRDFDATIGPVLSAPTADAGWLDLATDLAEAAADLGDAQRSELARQGLVRASSPPVVVAGRAWVCKGSVARYWALAAAGAGRVADSDGYFRSAAEAHRHLGAEILLARTLGEWGRSPSGRDPQRGAQLGRQSAELAQGLGSAGGREVLDQAS